MASSNLTQYAHDPVGFIDRYVRKDEKGRSFELSSHQRRILSKAFQWEEGSPPGQICRLLMTIFLWGEMKKSGKTLLAAALVLWWAFVVANTEIKIVANDLEQSVGRVFKSIVQLLKHNPVLARSAKVRAESITLSNSTTIDAISSDYKGAAGSRHSLVVYDELWGFSLERAERLFEELTPPPTEPNAWVLIVTYAGWTGESALLERLYKRGLEGARLDDELELYRNGDLTMFWSHTPRQPWQTEHYYDGQRAILRRSTFLRLHENRWVSSESAFITPELWDSCVDANYQPTLGTIEEAEYIGVDIGLKNDYVAVVRVRRRDNKIILAGYRLWKPTRNEPINLEETVETYLRQLHEQQLVRRIVIDPWQAARSIQTLQKARLPIEEFPQTVSNTTRMAAVLYDLLKGRNISLPIDDELRQQAFNTIAIETPRGFRIAKEKARQKIDAIVALAMACVAALECVQPSFGVVVGNGPCEGNAEEIKTVEVAGVTVDESIVQELAGLRETGGSAWFPDR